MTIKLHDLRPAPGSKTARTRVGRGEGSKGKTAGRGTKGTKARKNVPSTFEGGQMPIHMRLPKLKGFKNRFRTEYEVVNVGDINKLFPKGGDVGVDELVAAGAVRKNSLVKVLADGKLTVKVNVTAHKFSGSAREKRARTPAHPDWITSLLYFFAVFLSCFGFLTSRLRTLFPLPMIELLSVVVA